MPWMGYFVNNRNSGLTVLDSEESKIRVPGLVCHECCLSASDSVESYHHAPAAEKAEKEESAPFCISPSTCELTQPMGDHICLSEPGKATAPSTALWELNVGDECLSRGHHSNSIKPGSGLWLKNSTISLLILR